MKLELSTKDRIVLLGALPKNANLLEMGSIIEMQKLLNLSEEEEKAVNFRELSPGHVVWDKEETKEIELKHDHVTVLKKAIKKLDEAESIQPIQYDTFIKINNL